MPQNPPIYSRLLIWLVIFHLLLLLAAQFLPIWIGGQSALNYRWVRIANGSLNFAQYELLVCFWAISKCDWTKRTMWLLTGLVMLSLLHVAIMYTRSKSQDYPLKLLWNILLNTLDVFVGEALVLAVFLELFRPLWGILTREAPVRREQITIFALLRLTTLAALAAAVLRLSGSTLANPIWISIHWLLDACLMASCIWMIFAPKHAWVGFAGCLASLGGGVLNTPSAIVATNGPWHWLPSLCLTTFWICSTLLVVRQFGFRLRKQSVAENLPISDLL